MRGRDDLGTETSVCNDKRSCGTEIYDRWDKNTTPKSCRYQHLSRYQGDSALTIIQYSPFLAPLLLSATITGLLAILSLKRRNDPVIPPFILLMCATTLWTVCYAGQLATADLETNLLFNALEYPGIVTVPVAWLLVVLSYLGQDQILNRRNIAALFVIPIIDICLAVINPSGLYYLAYIPEIHNGIIVWNFVHGPLFWIHAGYSYLVSIIAAFLIGSRFFISPAIYRQQIVLMILAAVVPLAGNFCYVFGFNPVPGLDFTPFTFTFAGLVIALGILRFQLFAIAPIAFPLIFTTIEDGIIVLDRNNRVSDFNPAALKIVNNRGMLQVGDPAAAILPPEIMETFSCDETSNDGVRQVTLADREGLSRDYEVRCRTITSRVGQKSGRLVILRDVTGTLKAQRATEMANKKLNLLSNITRHDMLNKLAGLGLYIELARTEKNETVLHGYLDHIKEVTERFREELEFTRDYQDLGVGTPAWQKIRPFFNEKSTLLPVKNVRMDIAIPDDLEIYADLLLGKVFYNLIDNSLRYGGETMTEIRVTTREEDGALVLMFEDNGNGIPNEDKPRLFSKGFGKHTGLGLFLSREILAITGIAIAETGKPGEGARFEITIPEGAWRRA